MADVTADVQQNISDFFIGIIKISQWRKYQWEI